MQEKDIIEKHLENYEDVFIDVINVRVAFLEIRGHIRLDMPVVFEKLLD